MTQTPNNTNEKCCEKPKQSTNVLGDYSGECMNCGGAYKDTATTEEWEEFDKEFPHKYENDVITIAQARWGFANLITQEREKARQEVALMVSQAGMNKIPLRSDSETFTGTYWISANMLYFYLTGRHLNADFENGVIPRNPHIDELNEESTPERKGEGDITNNE